MALFKSAAPEIDEPWEAPVTDDVTPEYNDNPIDLPDNGDEPVAEAEIVKPKRTYTRKEIQPVPSFLLTADDVPADEVVALSTRERSDEQKIVDADVKSLHERWTDDGKPALAASPRKRYQVPPEHAEAVVRMLKKADSFLDVAVKIAPVVTSTTGQRVIQFTARDRTRKPRKAS